MFTGCLAWSTSERLTPDDALNTDWIRDGLRGTAGDTGGASALASSNGATVSQHRRHRARAVAGLTTEEGAHSSTRTADGVAGPVAGASAALAPPALAAGHHYAASTGGAAAGEANGAALAGPPSAPRRPPLPGGVLAAGGSLATGAEGMDPINSIGTGSATTAGAAAASGAGAPVLTATAPKFSTRSGAGRTAGPQYPASRAGDGQILGPSMHLHSASNGGTPRGAALGSMHHPQFSVSEDAVAGYNPTSARSDRARDRVRAAADQHFSGGGIHGTGIADFPGSFSR